MLSHNLREDATMIRLDLTYSQPRDGMASLELNTHVDGIRMFVTVATLKAVVETASQSAKLEKRHKRYKQLKFGSQPPQPSGAPKAEQHKPAPADASSTIKALKNIRVKVRATPADPMPTLRTPWLARRS